MVLHLTCRSRPTECRHFGYTRDVSEHFIATSMKQKILIFTSAILLTGFVYQKTYIDPTGAYKLDSKTKKKDGDIYGYSGRIQVKKITKNRIVMTFEVNKGAPSYNSGSFVDTLPYNDNRVIYTNSELDTTCKITFDFNKRGVIVKEQTEDFNSGCGFGHAVVVDGFFKKTSSKVPILIEPLTGKQIEN